MLGFIPSPGNVRILRSLILPCTCSRCSHHSQIVRVYSYTLGRKHTAHNLACARSYTFLHSSHPPDSHASDLVTHQSATSSKEKREEPENKRRGVCHERSKRWDLTVGIEVHAELATTTKLFSTASTDLTSASNVNTSVFDTASPGAQPRLQREALLPALRAALTLNCEIQAQSGWDRKHYFWWDQPQGYQITQYYSPFAKNGRLTLHPWDDFDPEDTVNGRGELNIGIKQIQMEQDTAKTLLQPPDTYLLDFNRAGLPLVEIITRPEIKSPKTAAAVVRKIQGMLQSVGANSVGMEMGGLRADVNVSVRKKDAIAQVEGLTYGGVTGLGQRTEIKNLSSFKAVEDAIVAERDRQIDVLESGAKVEGETRRWTLGATTTHRLRGKEGEVDYRYMPDPDLAPLHIGDSLVQYLSTTMPRTQDEWVKELINTTSNEPHRLSVEDAKVLANLDDGERLEFYLDTLKILEEELGQDKRIGYNQEVSLGQLVCNWVLMELPTYLTTTSSPFPYYYSPNPFPTSDATSSTSERCIGPTLGTHTLACLLYYLVTERITLSSARRLLPFCRLPSSSDPEPFPSTTTAQSAIRSLVATHNLWYNPLSPSEYDRLVREALESNPDMARKAREELRMSQGNKKGKVMWFVGQAVRSGEKGSIKAGEVEWRVLEALRDANGRTT